ncbi:hypothetical protein [Acinetobacter haemolyticus]|uniref:hypothetical protein n=1 Tax=Acinetobacter haemolyticus TaxID=29430 RepID=UPI0034CF4D28
MKSIICFLGLIVCSSPYANLTEAEEAQIIKYYKNNTFKSRTEFEKKRMDLEKKIIDNKADQMATLKEIGIIINGIGEHAVPKSFENRYYRMNCDLRELALRLIAINSSNPKYLDKLSLQHGYTQAKIAFEVCRPEDYKESGN